MWTETTIPLQTTSRPILFLLYFATDSRGLAYCKLALRTTLNAFLLLQCHFYQVDQHQVPKLSAQRVLNDLSMNNSAPILAAHRWKWVKNFGAQRSKTTAFQNYISQVLSSHLVRDICSHDSGLS